MLRVSNNKFVDSHSVAGWSIAEGSFSRHIMFCEDVFGILTNDNLVTVPFISVDFFICWGPLDGLHSVNRLCPSHCRTGSVSRGEEKYI